MTSQQAKGLSRIEVEYEGTKYWVVRLRAGYIVDGTEAGHGRYVMSKQGVCECKRYQYRGYCRHQKIIAKAVHEVEGIRYSARLDELLGKAEQQPILTREEIIRRGQEAIDLLFPDTRPWTPGNQPLPKERTAIAIDTAMGTEVFDPYNTYELPANARLIAA